MRLLPWRGLFQLGVPRLNQEPQLSAQGREFLDFAIQLIEAFSHKLTNASARRTALVADPEDSFQISKGKSDDECSLNQQHSLHRRGRVLPIPSRRSRDGRE